MSGDNHDNTANLNIKLKIPIPNYNQTKPMKFSQLVRNGHRYGKTQVVITEGYIAANQSYGVALKNKF